MNQSRLLALVAIAFLILGFAVGRLAPSNGRYSVNYTGSGWPKTDTRTGEVWISIGNDWRPLTGEQLETE